MLQSVHVKNLALIDEIEVEFGSGLNILTGETGAGKSIIMDSISLALGGRYTKEMIRAGADYGLVELAFTIENTNQEEALRTLEVYPENGVVILSRRIMDGRTTSRINGETASMSTLKSVAEIMLDMHGQHEHQSLLYKKNYIKIVDNFAKARLTETKRLVRDCYEKYNKCKKQLEEADIEEGQRMKVLSFLEFETKEIEAANIREGEDEELEDLFLQMSNAKKLAESANTVYGITSEGDESVSEKLSRAIRSMSDAPAYDKKAEELVKSLTEIDSLLSDFNYELSDYCKSLEFSPEEYMETEERLNTLNHLKSKYGHTIEDIQKYYSEQKDKIEKLNDFEAYIETLKNELKIAEDELAKASKELGKIRREEAEVLQTQIQNGLMELNFPEVRFRIDFSEKPFSADGTDDVDFMISLNPGQPLKLLSEVASGGELSRIMLAIKAVMADKDEIPTLIFDEIDVGISGRTAQKVSEKMAIIGKNHQVIAITHLAQIASMADEHFVIEKQVDHQDTVTTIRKVMDEESVIELARILGGAQITETVLENAREMKALASQIKQ